MFKDVGKELKNWARVVVLLHTFPYAVIGVILWIILSQEDLAILGFAVGAVIVAYGYILSRFKGIELYAYGELVDCVSIMKNHFCGENNSEMLKTAQDLHTNSEAARMEKDAKIHKPEGAWTCMICGHTNGANVKWCESCHESTKS